MIFQNIATVAGEKIDLHIDDGNNAIVAASHLLALPARLDPHVHFRTPGLEHKENWTTGAQAAINGGCTMVFDMPNTLPPTITEETLIAKKVLIDSQLTDANIPLRYRLFIGADKQHLDQLAKVKHQVIGIKVFMGCSTGNLVIDDDESLHAVFEIAAKEKMIVAVHAEDEALMCARKPYFQDENNYACHSEIRNVEVATRAVEKAIQLAKHYGAKLYVLHVSTMEEIALIKTAKTEGVNVYAETTPHHLFFNTDAYLALGGKAVVNPPLRESIHQPALWQAIKEGVIDTIGSDHAPHTLMEKNKKYGECPSGMPGIEFVLPLLFTALKQGKISLEKIVDLTAKRAREIFDITETNEDWVLVDPHLTAKVEKTASKCGWSPYMGLKLTGWPQYTVMRGKVYALKN